MIKIFTHAQNLGNLKSRISGQPGFLKLLKLIFYILIFSNDAINIFLSGCGEIGRRTRFRFWRREAWGFKSLHPHQVQLNIIEKSYLISVLPRAKIFSTFDNLVHDTRFVTDYPSIMPWCKIIRITWSNFDFRPIIVRTS